MGPEHEDSEGRPQGRGGSPLITPVYNYLALRLAMGGTVGVLLSIFLCVDGIFQDFNLELWIFTGIFFLVSLLMAIFSWRWLFLHRKKGSKNGEAGPPDSI
ncbi:MAG: hypothetical protein JW854_00135 [Actinobacteria bacterium]|nr:hypothetical protein [Actinomycetota bacterium]